MNKRETGSRYEDLAADFLRGKGYVILEKNFRCRIGEIDLVARDGAALVFVEVKYRKNRNFGYPEEAVSIYKQNKIIKTAQYYMCCHGLSDRVPCRFDIIAVEDQQIRHIENAFSI